MKFHIDEKKLNAFSNDLEIETLESNLKAWQLICEGNPDGGAIERLELSDRFRWLAACRSTIIQSSETHSGLCENPQVELEDIFETYVL